HPLGVGGPGLDQFGLEWGIGALFEDTVAAVRLVRSGLTDRFSNVKIIVPHLGGTVPFAWHRVTHADARVAAGLRHLYYDTVNGTPAAIRCACECVGASQLMLGTDYPYHTPLDCASYVESSDLDATDVAGILDGNAAQLLGLSKAGV